MKKILKLLVLIFLLASCSPVTEIELGGEDPNSSIEKTDKDLDQEKIDAFDPGMNEQVINNPTTSVEVEIDRDDQEEVEDSKEDESNDEEVDLEDKDSEEEIENSSGDSEKDPKENNSQDREDNMVELEDKEPEDDKNSKDQVEENKPDLEVQKDGKDQEPAADNNQAEDDEPENSEQNKPERQEGKNQVSEKRPEDPDILSGLQANMIYYDGASVNYLDIGIDNYNIDVTQRYIDDGNIISTVTKFDPYDSEITYFSGHTYNYNNVSRLQISSLVTITDSNGLGYNYRIIDYKKYPAGQVEHDAPFIGGYHLMDLAGEGIGRESIVIQYCDDEDVPMIFFGIPE
ncbi:MAG: hypothetical protein Q4E50_02105 [Tissierellia bacterium]|nr:hypothetical protein [Tissierellia bacterium]